MAYGVGKTITVDNATIAATGTESTEIELGNTCLASFVITSTWVSADMELKGSYDGSTYYSVYDKDGKWSATVDQNYLVKIDPVYTHGLKFVKFVSSAAQTNGATIQYSLRPVD
jgi:hypothetical protein